MVARGLGWTVLGVAIGMSEGIAARSLGKFSYGTVGGAIGGFFGGCMFGLFYYIAVHAQAGGLAIGPTPCGLVILGACIGSLSALVQGVFQPASVQVLRGWQEGREYPLEKPAILLGRDEHADIALFRDMKVEKKHAFIKRVGHRYILVNNGARRAIHPGQRRTRVPKPGIARRRPNSARQCADALPGPGRGESAQSATEVAKVITGPR